MKGENNNMKIVINYEESHGTQDYMNDILEAIDLVNGQKAIALNTVEFINYPLTSVADVLTCIRRATSKGTVCFTQEGIVYEKTEKSLIVAI